MRLGRDNPAVHAPPAPPVERVLMVGDGVFIRAFVGPLLQRLRAAGLFDGSVVVTPARARDAVSRPVTTLDDLRAQDYLYTVWTRGQAGGQAIDGTEIVSVVSRGVDPFADWGAFLACAEQESIGVVVSNTTELGIAYAPAPYPRDRAPVLYPARLAAYLKRRHDRFGGAPEAGLVVLPCELIEDNADRLRAIVLRHADDWGLGADFARWVREDNAFCATLVDRIVPGFPRGDPAALWERLGYEDRRLVVAEMFSLWAIARDERAMRLLPFHALGQDAGVRYADDLLPYRIRKLRVLNGAHTFMAALGLWLGLATVRDAMDDPLLGPLVRRVVDDVIAPHSELAADALRAYAATVFDRFANPHVEHRLTAIALNAAGKFRIRLLPVLLRYHEAHGRAPDALCACLAAVLLLYRRGTGRDVGDDPEVRGALASAGGTGAQVRRILADEALWGRDLTGSAGLVDGVASYADRIARGEVREALAAAHLQLVKDSSLPHGKTHPVLGQRLSL